MEGPPGEAVEVARESGVVADVAAARALESGLRRAYRDLDLVSFLDSFFSRESCFLSIGSSGRTRTTTRTFIAQAPYIGAESTKQSMEHYRARAGDRHLLATLARNLSLGEPGERASWRGFPIL